MDASGGLVGSTEQQGTRNFQFPSDKLSIYYLEVEPSDGS